MHFPPSIRAGRAASRTSNDWKNSRHKIPMVGSFARAFREGVLDWRNASVMIRAFAICRFRSGFAEREEE
jgi:hypothetical protein